MFARNPPAGSGAVSARVSCGAGSRSSAVRWCFSRLKSRSLACLPNFSFERPRTLKKPGGDVIRTGTVAGLVCYPELVFCPRRSSLFEGCGSLFMRRLRSRLRLVWGGARCDWRPATRRHRRAGISSARSGLRSRLETRRPATGVNVLPQRRQPDARIGRHFGGGQNALARRDLVFEIFGALRHGTALLYGVRGCLVPVARGRSRSRWRGVICHTRSHFAPDAENTLKCSQLNKYHHCSNGASI